MKLIKLTALAFFLMSIIACNKDEESTSSDEIVGTWKMTELNYTGTSITTISATGQTATVSFSGIANNFVNAKVIFTNNPNKYASSGSYNVKLTTTSSPNGPVETNQGVQLMETGAWVKNGNKIITTSSPANDVSEAEILTLNSTTMKLRIQKTINQTLAPGVTSTSSTTSYQTLTR